jgi:nucleoid-associated protein YgaU
MGMTTLDFSDAKLELARQRESQSAEETTHSSDTSSPSSAAPSPAPSEGRDHVGQPLPRGSRLTDLQSSSSELGGVTYTVQRGDTLRGIAEWFYGDRGRSQALYAANRPTIGDPQSSSPARSCSSRSPTARRRWPDRQATVSRSFRGWKPTSFVVEF